MNLRPTLPNNTRSQERNATEVAQSDYMLSQLLQNAGIGIWNFAIDADEISLCPTASAFFKNSKASVSIFRILRLILLQDARFLIKALNKACRKKGSLSADVRLITAIDENPRWLRISGKYNNDKGNEALGGTIIDISAEKAEEQRKEDYVALLNHELKSPLTTIKLYVQMALKQISLGQADQISETLDKAEMQVGVMSRMIDNFLTTSAVSNSSLQLVHEPFDMVKLIHDTVTEIGMIYPDRKFDICFSSDAIVFADREKIAQVLVNYLSNAVKYSPAKGSISVKCRTHADQVQVSVTDEGRGIAPEDQAKIFDRFYRTNPNGIKGFGLGLYLVKEIINSHKGKVWLDSVPSGGSTFHFSLPALGLK
ncbi:PAS domain-containing sensor histidine kinase [Pedobacter duraquae]|nr:HAMP domain-containing sensor histidine kinase [Pedobacter duraquae]